VVKQTLVLLFTVCTCYPCVPLRIKLCVFGCVLLFHYLFVFFLSFCVSFITILLALFLLFVSLLFF
jgi:hypothetical protein